MSKNCVTEDRIDALLEASEISTRTEYEKVTVVNCKLPNGFVLTQASGAVDKANYSEEIGRKVCLKRIKSRLWELEGYKLACEMAEDKEDWNED